MTKFRRCPTPRFAGCNLKSMTLSNNGSDYVPGAGVTHTSNGSVRSALLRRVYKCKQCGTDNKCEDLK